MNKIELPENIKLEDGGPLLPPAYPQPAPTLQHITDLLH